MTEPAARPSYEDLEALVTRLREEVARLREELRLARRREHQAPPHHLD